MQIDSLVIEITRRCNVSCDHCLRGDAENVDMSPMYIDELFKHLSYVSTITFTGGEPSLVPHLIEETLQIAEKHGVGIGSFYIATNALKITDAFLLAVMRLYCYCDDNETSCLHWSNDIFHPEVDTRKLEVFKFAGPKFGSDGSQSYRWGVIEEGRGIDCGLKTNINITESFEVEEDEVEEDIISEGIVYLNCEGNIIAGCDWSYASQRNPDKIVCHVSEFSIEKFIEFNDSFEED